MLVHLNTPQISLEGFIELHQIFTALATTQARDLT
jgi:hypothetical protein